MTGLEGPVVLEVLVDGECVDLARQHIRYVSGRRFVVSQVTKVTDVCVCVYVCEFFAVFEFVVFILSREL